MLLPTHSSTRKQFIYQVLLKYYFVKTKDIERLYYFINKCRDNELIYLYSVKTKALKKTITSSINVAERNLKDHLSYTYTLQYYYVTLSSSGNLQILIDIRLPEKINQH